ncbi:hypothetical protein POM88_029604 [Heracleum sosnowskyi]|uniref:F-box domain-containing protein n=1 Tax=Heracleum sosnowskyi TaxID=360622 RepID=A0AAD8MHA9_9APIA|nr:hypothetical protein POM88_029604 [Heracleum sosnowskyi]
MASHAKAIQYEFGALTLDRISNLPINVLHLILERLPLHDAARTSILSKTWRSTWELQGVLVFDDVFFSHLASDVSATISHILLVRSGPLFKFHLSIPLNLPVLHTDMWIKNISNRGVKILKIFNNLQTSYRMPSYLFSCTELTHLTLDNCILNPPLGFKGFCNLSSVRLMYVMITADMSFGTQLETLDLKYCTGIKYLGGQFKCNSNIRKLIIADCGKINWRWFEYTRNVETLGLMFEKRSNCRRKIINLDRVVGNMPKIQVLLLGGLFLERLTTTMENLTFLQLFHFGIYDLGQIQSFFALIRSSPNLQNLRIMLRPGLEEYLQLPNVDDVILGQIEKVDIQGMAGSRSELSFIKFLLASSPSLIWMKLSKSVTVTDPREELRILGEVTRLPRASTTAQIIWN